MQDSSSLIKHRSMVMILIGVLIILIIIPISLWNTNLFSTYMDLLTPILSFFTAGLLVYTAVWSYKEHPDVFMAWTVLSLAMVLYSVASLFYFILDNFLIASFIVSDILYAVAYPLLVAGIFLLMKKPFKIKYKELLDVLIVMVSIFFIVWFTWIWPMVGPSQPDTLSDIISISYLFLDLGLLLFILALAFTENRKIPGLTVVLFSTGMFLQVLGDMVYAYNVVSPFLTFKWLFTVFYTSNSFLIILAVMCYLNNIDVDLRTLILSYRRTILQNYLFPYLPLILAFFTYGLLIITTPSEALIWGVGVMVFLVILRQIISLNEIKKAQITLKKNEELIYEQNEQLTFITSNMLDLITQSDKEGVFNYVSPSSQHVLGYSPEYLMGKSIFDIVHPDDVEKITRSARTSMESVVDVRLQYRAKNVDGSYIWMEAAGKPFFENNEIKGFIYSSRDITERKKSEEFVKKSLIEKETLLKEIHHRVNNNLQIIISLLNLQSKNVVDKKDYELFFESQNRVKSMAIIYEKLYQSEDLNSINFSDYVKTLLNHLMYTYSQNLYRVDLVLDIEDINLNLETSVPCGLIINEIVSNSLKHAFPFGRKGIITVKMHQKKGEYILLLGDDGVGFSHKLDKEPITLGLNLIYSLVNQLDAHIELLEGKGTVYKITFKELRYEERI